MEGLALPDGNRTDSNCGVTAVAIAAGVSFEEAMEVFYGIRRNRSKRWKGATSITQRAKALIRLNVRHFPHRPERRMQLDTWIEQHTRRGVRYLVTTTGHVQIVKDGYVTDQCNEAKPVAEYRWRRKIVKHVIELSV